MILGFQYTYLLLSLVFLIVWLIFFLLGKNLRREMLSMSWPFGFVGMIVEPAYVHDWWKPLTITGTMVGIEDFITGFAIAGIAAVAYEYFFKKHLSQRRQNKREQKNKKIFILTFGLLFAAFFGVSFVVFSLNSFISSVLAFIFGIFTIYLNRRDLIIPSLISGLIFLVIASLIYTVVNLFTPGWVQEFWYFKNVPNIVIFSVPIDDIIWYFLAGAFIGPLYEYWQEARLVRES